MKKKLLTCALFATSLCTTAQTTPLWMRYCAISPNGKTIAFAYKGDIFTVPTHGGEALQITSNPAYEAYPIWSPDGSKIAFASTREGSFDIYIVDKDGGTPKRLTTNSGTETPITFKDSDHILFMANEMPSAGSNIFPGNFSQVYEVSTKGGKPKMFSTLQMEDISINQNGDILYHNNNGYEDKYRKHHRSPITRDIWLLKDGKFTQKTNFEGEDRTPVWAPDGKAFYYLSEQDGTFNIYKYSPGDIIQQMTSFKQNPVRFLTISNNGLLCFGYDGEIYTMKEGEAPKKVNIVIKTDKNDRDLVREIKRNGATNIALSPSGKEIAFIMKGDVYVTSTEYKTTKQITNTPEQERDIDFSPDGRSIAYDSERGGLWQIYQTSIKNKNEKSFVYATELTEEQLVKSDKTSQTPKYSPDGKSIAFREDRGTLKVLDIKSKQTRNVMDGKYVYSYSDGDINYDWSPDSKWLLSSYMGNEGWNNADIALVKADGSGELHNLTESGYSDSNPKWVLGGKAMAFESDRAGYRSHGSWGSEDDVYLMFFDLDAYDRFRMSKEERKLADDQKDTEKESQKEKKGKKGKKKDLAKNKELTFDLENCKDRIVRLTNNSAHMGDYILSPQGDSLYYQAAFEAGFDLWKKEMESSKIEIVSKGLGFGNMVSDKDFKHIYTCTNGTIKQFDVAKASVKNIEFEATFNYQPYKERKYMFDHVWQQIKDKFYDPKLHGVDWEGYKKNYEKFLPHINNGYDFSNMLSEMLGELNASHTGARFYAEGPKLYTACLGVFTDDKYDGDGIKIEEVIKGGPFSIKNTGVTEGCVIESIDGVKIERDMDYNHLLDGKAHKSIRVGIYNPSTKKHFFANIKPISKGEQDELLYKRWVKHNKELVDKLSNGHLAYVHVKAMDSKSFREVYSKLLNEENRQKDAVIVDERHNGGGWLHDDLCTLLSGKEYQKFIPHGKLIGRDPFNKWVKPSCVLICEDDYSNGYGFPWVYKTLGIGKLIGAPVAGTMTAVWWERMLDPRFVFGIPQVGCQGMDGKFAENEQLNPDIEVYNRPEDYISGNDKQLEAAVKEMMKYAKKK